MFKLLQSIVRVFVGLLAVIVLSVAAFDVAVVRPAVSTIESLLSDASADERNPPAAVALLMHRFYGEGLKYHVARMVVRSSAELDRMSTSNRQVREIGIGLLMPLHLSDDQIQTAFLSRVYMGLTVRGFSQASQRHLHTPLAAVSNEQAAKLVAIASSPTLYLEDPVRLKKQAEYLLSLPPRP